MATCPDDGRAEGARRRDDAHALLRARRPVLLRRAQRALVEHLLLAGAATADDVRALVRLPPGIDPRCLGTVPGPLAAAGIIRRDGYTMSARAVAHARPVSLWRLVDAGAAADWLATHPELPEPEGGEPPGRQPTLWD